MPRNNFSNIAVLKKFASRADSSVVVIFVFMVILSAVLQDNFFEHRAMARNINAYAPLVLMAMGQAIVLISGNVDLSVGSNLSMQVCLLTYVMKTEDPITGIYALVACFAAAIAVGLVNGFGVGYLRIHPIVLTFATSYMCLGTALFIRPTPGGQCTNWFKGFYSFGFVDGSPAWLRNFGAYFPPVLFLVILACTLWFVISRTRTGRYIYAVGSSRDNAYASGIDTAKVQIKAYVVNSVFIFLVAIFFAAQNQSGDARMGDPLTLRAIAAAVVGGIALSGGQGSVYLALLGALTLSLVNKAIFFANIPNAFQTLVNGLVVILAISSSAIYSYVGKKMALRAGG
ncbi:MAG: ABC transporter permease [Treponema sp.]|jgi:ribose transport system permease protein|nr:ABC transporter permease [Treponema sp.]